jgi:hypothetical protein
MNEGRFDELTRSLANGRVSRGRMLKLAAAAAFGSVLGVGGIIENTEDAAGKATPKPNNCRPGGTRCSQDKQCCTGKCANNGTCCHTCSSNNCEQCDETDGTCFNVCQDSTECQFCNGNGTCISYCTGCESCGFDGKTCVNTCAGDCVVCSETVCFPDATKCNSCSQCQCRFEGPPFPDGNRVVRCRCVPIQCGPCEECQGGECVTTCEPCDGCVGGECVTPDCGSLGKVLDPTTCACVCPAGRIECGAACCNPDNCEECDPTTGTCRACERLGPDFNCCGPSGFRGCFHVTDQHHCGTCDNNCIEKCNSGGGRCCDGICKVSATTCAEGRTC